MDEHMKKSTDLVHHHIRPFTVIQKIDDFTPMSLTVNKKIIETVEEVKQMNMVFGDLIGLHLQAKIRTESRYTDMRSIMERLAVFNYNPVNMLLFPNTLAMNPAGTIQILRNQDGGLDQMIIQWRAIQTTLLQVYDAKWGHFERAKMTLKMLPAS